MVQQVPIPDEIADWVSESLRNSQANEERTLSLRLAVRRGGGVKSAFAVSPLRRDNLRWASEWGSLPTEARECLTRAKVGGVDGTRTRGLCRDRAAF